MLPTDVSGATDLATLAQQMMANITEGPGSGGVAEIMGLSDPLSPTRTDFSESLSKRRQRRQREPFNAAKDFAASPYTVELPPTPGTPASVVNDTLHEDPEAEAKEAEDAGATEVVESEPEGDAEGANGCRTSVHSHRRRSSAASSRRGSTASRRSRPSMTRSGSEQSNLSRKSMHSAHSHSTHSVHSIHSVHSAHSSHSASDDVNSFHRRSASFVSATSEGDMPDLPENDAEPVPVRSASASPAKSLLSLASPPPIPALIPPSDDEGDDTVVLPKAPE